MEKKSKFYNSIPGVALGTGLILLAVFVAMQFTDEVNWSVSDFIMAGILLFCTGLAFAFVWKKGITVTYRTAVVFAVLSTFLLVWVNLAVGLIGSGPNAPNLMYIGVVATGIIGTFRSAFRPAGMERAMYGVVLALGLHTVITLSIGVYRYGSSAIGEILLVNGFFAMLFILSGLCFRFATQDIPPVKPEGT